LVSEIPAGNGKTANLFSQCKAEKTWPVQLLHECPNNVKCPVYIYVVVLVPHEPLYLNFKLSSGQQSHFSDIWWACGLCGALMFLLEPSTKYVHLKSTIVYALHRNWDSPPTPHPQASVPPPPCFWGEGNTRWRERGWESPNSDEGHTLWYSLYVRTLWSQGAREMQRGALLLFEYSKVTAIPITLGPYFPSVYRGQDRDQFDDTIDQRKYIS
jgi:hypothetical protein